MNHMTMNADFFDPINKPIYYVDPVQCDGCGCKLNEAEREDPCEIDGRLLCDDCASHLTHLRMAMILPKVSDRTNELVTENWLRKESETMNDFRNLINSL